MKPRFTIRAMLVATTLLAVWCAYSVNWIRQRRELVASRVAFPYDLPKDKGAKRRAPGLLFLFGEPGYLRVMVDELETDPEFDRIQALFPEAECNGNVYIGGSDAAP